MNVIRITNTGIEEPCPEAPTPDLNGFYRPTDRQLEVLFSHGNDGRLNPSLRDNSFVQWGDAVGTLASAAVFRMLEISAATAPAMFGGLGNPDVSIALADLSVSGASNLADFRRVATLRGAADIPALRRHVMATLPLAAARMGVTLSRGGLAQIPAAVDHVVDRALEVVWALHGPSAHRLARRPDLGWIAVNAERDPPPRPVNVPATPWPMADLEVRVLHAGQFFNCRIRYAIAGSTEAPSTVSVLNDLPDTVTPPLIPPDTLVLVFLHGHSSSLEEGFQLYRDGLLTQYTESCLRHPVAMIAFDFPTNGYSEYIDHETLSPLEDTTRFVPDRPLQRRFGLLEFYERLVVRFVDTLNSRMVEAGQPGFLDRIGAVIGGSMGGNLALRLSERLVTYAPWLDALVAWSPASVYGSFGRADYIIPSPGEHVDPIQKEALERPHQRCLESETEDSRRNFIGLQMQGERLINDGTPEFEAGVRLLTVLGFPIILLHGSLIGAIAPIIFGPILGPLVSGFVGGAVFATFAGVEEVANVITVKQSDEWLQGLSAECRDSFDSTASSRGALLYLQETYNSRRRQMHWRIAYEQLLFSHQDEVAASGGVPCYEASVVPTLLISGAYDVVDERFNIFGSVSTIAPRMISNPGYTLLIEETGHSIHIERPLWLAKEIYSFLGSRRPPRRVIAVHREGGRISALEFGGLWKPIPVETAIAQGLNAGGITPYYVEDTEGDRTQILARRYLTTQPDEWIDNNLRSLPMTSQPEPEDSVRGPQQGFEVTHIRVHEGLPGHPWSSWVTHLCNDEHGYQVSNFLAEEAVRTGEARYFIQTDDGENELILTQYLTTAPDVTIENNLSNLPDA
jgi:hypothetical protein